MVIAPTEPGPLLDLVRGPDAEFKGRISPEMEDRYGVDVFWVALKRLIGVQRKRVDDLVRSIQTGHMGEQFAKMKSLDVGVLLIEGRINWTNDGQLILPWGTFSKRSMYGLLWSARDAGIWVEYSDSLADTVAVIRWLEAWTRKPRHTSARAARPVGDPWGVPGNHEFQASLLTAIPGIGPELAARMVAEFGGAPLAWTVTREEMVRRVKGLGKARVDRAFRALPEQFAIAG